MTVAAVELALTVSADNIVSVGHVVMCDLHCWAVIFHDLVIFNRACSGNGHFCAVVIVMIY